MRAETVAADEFWLSDALATTEKVYSVPEVNPVITNEVSLAPG